MSSQKLGGTEIFRRSRTLEHQTERVQSVFAYIHVLFSSARRLPNLLPCILLFTGQLVIAIRALYFQCRLFSEL